MKGGFALACCLSLGANVANAQVGVRANYAPGSQFVGGGYRDKQLTSNSWRVSSYIGGTKPTYLTEKVVLYRASELVESANFKYVHITSRNSHKIVEVGAAFVSAGGETKITIAGSNEPALTGHCESNVTVQCDSFLAQTAKDEMRPFLNFKR